VEWNRDRSGGICNGVPFSVNKLDLGDRRQHWIEGDASFNVEIVHVDKEQKLLTVVVNGTRYQVQVSDRYDDLLTSLGMEDTGKNKIKSLKAPMSGLVLQVNVGEGELVEKDTPLVILEAMKMENVIKSPGEGKIKRIAAVKGQPVEKGALMIEFE
jgi:biotin carboxyl carrier protein